MTALFVAQWISSGLVGLVLGYALLVHLRPEQYSWSPLIERAGELRDEISDRVETAVRTLHRSNDRHGE